MTYTIGVDCDLTLSHPLVDGGAEFGFLLYNLAPGQVLPKSAYGPPIKIHYEAYNDALGIPHDVRHLWFVIVIANGLLNPDGSPHADSAAVMRAKILELCQYHDSNLTLNTPSGLVTGLNTLDNILIDTIYPGMETIEVHLTSSTFVFASPDPIAWFNSFWVDLATYTGPRTWNNSYWR